MGAQGEIFEPNYFFSIKSTQTHLFLTIQNKKKLEEKKISRKKMENVCNLILR